MKLPYSEHLSFTTTGALFLSEEEQPQLTGPEPNPPAETHVAARRNADASLMILEDMIEGGLEISRGEEGEGWG